MKDNDSSPISFPTILLKTQLKLSTQNENPKPNNKTKPKTNPKNLNNNQTII